MRKYISDVMNTVEKKGIDLGRMKNVCVSLDINGPLTSTNSAALIPYPGIEDLIAELKKLNVYIILNSSWDVSTSKIFNQKRLGGMVDGIIGEGGYTYTIGDNGVQSTADINTEECVLDLFISAMKECSKKGYSFADQGNLVNACYYHEFERGLVKNVCRDGLPRPTAKQFSDSLKKYDPDVVVTNENVKFIESREGYKALQKLLTVDYKLVTVRPDISDGMISLQLEGYSDKNISLPEMYPLAEDTLDNLGGWDDYQVNDDFCIDYFLSKKFLGGELNKGIALDVFLEQMCTKTGHDRNDFLVLGVGDSISDTAVGGIANSIFVGLKGSDAANNSDVVVPDGLVFLQLSKKIVKRLTGNYV